MELEPAVAAIFFAMCGINFVMVPLLMLVTHQQRKAIRAYRSVVSTEQRILVSDLLTEDDKE